jgi:hypothetical protein
LKGGSENDICTKTDGADDDGLVTDGTGGKTIFSIKFLMFHERKGGFGMSGMSIPGSSRSSRTIGDCAREAPVERAHMM